MGFMIINALPNETINNLNNRFHLSLIKDLPTGGTIIPKIDEFNKYKIMMESNKPVEYNRNTY